MKAGFVIALLVIAMICASAKSQGMTAEDWYEKGRAQLGRVPLEEVIKAYDKAIEISPNNATYWAAKGSTLSFLALTTGNNQSRYNESLQAYNRALQLDSENPWTLDQVGSTLLQMKRYNDSLEARDRAILYIDEYQGNLPVTKKEMLSSIWAGKAFTLQEAGRVDEALAAFDTAIAIDPGNYEARMMKGRALEAMGNQDGPFQTSSMVQDDGHEPQSNASLMTITFEKSDEHLKNGSIEEANLALDKALQLGPQNASIWLSKALTLELLGKGNESQKAFQKSLDLSDEDLKKNPQDADTWFKKAEVLVSLNRREEAVSAYQKAIDLNTSKALSAWMSKGYLLMELERHDESLEALDRALEEIPSDDEQTLERAWEFKAIVLQEMNRLEESYQAFDRLTELNGENKMAWIEKGYLQRELGRYNESLEAYETVLQLEPLTKMEASRAWIGKGRALDDMGMKEEAQEAYARALEIHDQQLQENPRDSIAWRDKGMTLYGMGRYEDALKAYDSVIAISLSPSMAGVTAQAWSGKGDAMLKLGRNEEALEAYRQAIELYPLDYGAWHGKGQALQALGKRIEGDWAFKVAKKLGYRE